MKVEENKRLIKTFLLSIVLVLVFSGNLYSQEDSEPPIESPRQIEGEIVEPLPDSDVERALPGKIIFLNFASGEVGLITEGEPVNYKVTALTPTRRGTGKAAAAGLTFGLLGAVAIPSIIAANANALKPDELYDMLAFFPDSDSFFITSPFASKSFQCGFFKKKKIRKFSFGGCDPEILSDGKTLFIGASSKDKDGKILAYDLDSKKRLDFVIEGNKRQWWPRHSPDGSSMLFLEGDFEQSDIILYDFKTKTKSILVSKDVNPVHPAWSGTGDFIVYASLKDRQLHKLVIHTKEDSILTSSPFFKLYPTICNNDKIILFSQAQLDVRSGSVGGRFKLKWYSLEENKIYTVPMNDHPKFFSAVQGHWINIKK